VSIDLADLIRRRKPEKKLQPLKARDRGALQQFKDLRVRSDTKLLLDTGIYISQAAGRLTGDQTEKLARVAQHHCTVCLGEIAVGLANRNVTALSWPDERNFWVEYFAKLPRNRTYAPDAEIWIEAGILAGTLTRLQGFRPHQRKDALNDALIFLTALKHGMPVLTENRRDFDWLQQLGPCGPFLSGLSVLLAPRTWPAWTGAARATVAGPAGGRSDQASVFVVARCTIMARWATRTTL
jgi:predicted nucleic acid-binding protein